MEIVLASQSPRRKQLLEMLNIDYLAVNHSFDESSVIKTSTPEEYCKIISRGKANSIKESFNNTILAADTIVSIDNIILEKPVDRQEAYRMLSILNNNRHDVLTGVTILDKKKDINFSFIEKTKVYFNNIVKYTIILITINHLINQGHTASKILVPFLSND